MKEKNEISFLCRLRVEVEVQVEVAVWDWKEIWPKGIRSTFNRRPHLGVKSDGSGFLKVDLFQ